MATSTASSTSTFGAAPQVPGSFQLVLRNSATSALMLIFSAMALALLGGRRRLGARLGRLHGRRALERHVHRELGDAPLVDARRLDLDQLRVLEPRRRL